MRVKNLKDRRPTLKDVALAAGVSIGTVDRALHDRGRINPEIRAKVLRKVKELGYTTNSIARTLVRNKKTAIALIMPDINEFWQEMLSGIMTSAKEWIDYDVKIDLYPLSSDDDAKSLFNTLKILEKSLPDGVIIVPFNVEEQKKQIKKLVSRGVKVITVNRDCPGSGRVCYVGEDAYLLGHTTGVLHSKFLKPGDAAAVIYGENEEEQIQRRCKGYIDAVKESEPDARIIKEAMGGYGAGETALELLKKHNGIRAVFTDTNTASRQLAQSAGSLAAEKKIIISGIDANSDGLKLLDEKKLTFLVSQNPFAQGYDAARIMLDLLIKSNSPPKEHNYTRISVIIGRNHYNNNKNLYEGE
jgi:LacI family transcriptional regulator